VPDDRPSLGSAEAILGAVAYAAERFLGIGSWREVLDDVLERLGRAAGVSRVYVFENSREDGVLYLSQTSEWTAPGVEPQIENPDLVHMSYVEWGFGPWAERLSRGDIVIERLSHASGRVRQLLDTQQIQTFLLVPVSSGSEWWGLIGFDDCVTEREWELPFVEALRAAAGVLGAAIARETTEHDLREAETRFRTLVEKMPTVTHISALDRKASTIYMSPQVEDMLGYPLQRWYDEPDLWIKILHPDDRDTVIATNERHISTGEPFEMDYRLLAADGRVVWIREQSDVVRDDDGTPTVSQGILLDITARKEAEEELQDSLRLLRRASEDRRRLFADLSNAQELARAQIAIDIHDDPLQKVTAVGLRMGMLRQRLTDPELAEEAEKLEALASSATASLRGLLFEMYPMQLERHGLGEALRDLMEQIEGLESHLEDELGERPSPEIEAICFRIAQAAVANARDHAGASTLRVRLWREAEGVRCSVSDDGRGFDPAAVEPSPGHLGLGSMRERAELAGGWVRIDSSPGMGTAVEFWVPEGPSGGSLR
jgi:PAS domain S-box-containing protein